MLKVFLQFRHRRFRRDLSAYLDGVLPQRARRRLEAHLDSCQACHQELTELRSTVEALGSLPMAEVPRSFALSAAPIAEVRPRPAARQLEFGLRLATATAAFALTLVLIGDFAGLPSGGEKDEMRGGFLSAAQETPAAMESAPAAPDIMSIQPEEPLFGQYGPSGEVSPIETPAAEDVVPAETPAAEGMAAADETPPALAAPPVETPAADETPPATAAAPAETPAAEQTPPPIAAAPVETPTAVGATPAEIPAAEETPPAPAAAPTETPAAVETPEPSGITETYGEEPTVGAGVSEDEDAEKAATEGAGGEEQSETYASHDQAAAVEEGGGLSREEAVRWLEIGLGAGAGVLVVLWALARLQRSIGSRP
jgi:hypothetical protein